MPLGANRFASGNSREKVINIVLETRKLGICTMIMILSPNFNGIFSAKALPDINVEKLAIGSLSN